MLYFLYRARDLGTLLTNRYLSGSRPPEEEVLELIKQLSAIEFDLDASHEHINEGTVVLTKMISSSCGEYLMESHFLCGEGIHKNWPIYFIKGFLI